MIQLHFALSPTDYSQFSTVWFHHVVLVRGTRQWLHLCSSICHPHHTNQLPSWSGPYGSQSGPWTLWHSKGKCSPWNIPELLLLIILESRLANEIYENLSCMVFAVDNSTMFFKIDYAIDHICNLCSIFTDIKYVHSTHQHTLMDVLSPLLTVTSLCNRILLLYLYFIGQLKYGGYPQLFKPHCLYTLAKPYSTCLHKFV